MRGIVSAAGYVPYRRLARADIAAFMGSGGGKGTRAVASHDEDTTTLGVEAARLALRGAPGHTPDAVWFSTARPAYLDKTNATAVAAALRLPADVGAYDFGGALRSGTGALLAALRGGGTTLVVARTCATVCPPARTSRPAVTPAAPCWSATDPICWPSSSRRRRPPTSSPIAGGLRAIGSPSCGRSVSARTATWRWAATPSDRALKSAGLAAGDVGRLVVTGMHGRAVSGLTRKLGLGEGVVADDLSAQRRPERRGPSPPRPGGHPRSRWPGRLRRARRSSSSTWPMAPTPWSCAPRRRWTRGVRPARWPSRWPHGAPLTYSKFLSWRGQLTPEPPRRPEPARVSSSAAHRNEDWKFGFVGSKDRSSGALHLPPSRISMEGGALDDMEPVGMADAVGTVVTSTIDRLAYSPSPPIVFAVVDFDGGGRYPVELTDTDADEIRAGSRVEMTFRRLFSADGIHDYFWKARPVRMGGDA